MAWGCTRGPPDGVQKWHVMVDGDWKLEPEAFFSGETEGEAATEPVVASDFTLVEGLNGLWQPTRQKCSGCPIYKSKSGKFRLYHCDQRSKVFFALAHALVQTPSFRVGRKIDQCRLGKSLSFFQSPGSGGEIHQRNLKERWRGCANIGKMGLEKMGKLSTTVPFSSNFSLISYQFHAYFIHFPKCTFGKFSQLPIFLHFPPFAPPAPPFSTISPHFPPISLISPHFPPFSQPPVAGRLIRLWLTWKPENLPRRRLPPSLQGSISLRVQDPSSRLQNALEELLDRAAGVMPWPPQISMVWDGAYCAGASLIWVERDLSQSCSATTWDAPTSVVEPVVPVLAPGTFQIALTMLGPKVCHKWVRK